MKNKRQWKGVIIPDTHVRNGHSRAVRPPRGGLMSNIAMNIGCSPKIAPSAQPPSPPPGYPVSLHMFRLPGTVPGMAAGNLA